MLSNGLSYAELTPGATFEDVLTGQVFTAEGDNPTVKVLAVPGVRQAPTGAQAASHDCPEEFDHRVKRTVEGDAAGDNVRTVHVRSLPEQQ